MVQTEVKMALNLLPCFSKLCEKLNREVLITILGYRNKNGCHQTHFVLHVY